MKYIYAEYMLNGTFHSECFITWNAFHEATFSPDTDIRIVRVIK